MFALLGRVNDPEYGVVREAPPLEGVGKLWRLFEGIRLEELELF